MPPLRVTTVPGPPNAALLATTSFPADTVVPPVKGLAPDKVTVPLPAMPKATLPAIVPEKVFDPVVSSVRVAVAPLSVTVPVAAPPSERPPTVWL